MSLKRFWPLLCVLLIALIGISLFYGCRAANDTSFVNPTSTSTNPLFAEGVPEHLQCPPELIGAYSVSPEAAKGFQAVGLEILEKWNPNRPLTEVWPAFIEMEKRYHANADPEHKTYAWGAGRVDWNFQLLLDFPEMGVLMQEDPDRSFEMRLVELGVWPPDFNILDLPDGSGRPFRTDNDKKYEFTSSERNETETGYQESTSTFKFSTTNDPDAEIVRINLDEITDEELERLSGWNYNTNPYVTGAYKLGDNR